MERKGYVVLKANGEVEVRLYEGADGKTFFKFVKENDIHCDVAEPIRTLTWLKNLPPTFLLCNENGYAELGNNPSSVNIIGTWLYNEMYNVPEVSYVLGDLVLCTVTEDENGEPDFAPFGIHDAEFLARMAKRWKAKAEEKYHRPEAVPSPFVSIQTFGSIDDMMKSIGWRA